MGIMGIRDGKFSRRGLLGTLELMYTDFSQ